MSAPSHHRFHSRPTRDPSTTIEVIELVCFSIRRDAGLLTEAKPAASGAFGQPCTAPTRGGFPSCSIRASSKTFVAALLYRKQLIRAFLSHFDSQFAFSRVNSGQQLSSPPRLFPSTRILQRSRLIITPDFSSTCAPTETGLEDVEPYVCALECAHQDDPGDPVRSHVP